VDDELERMLKEVVMAYFEVCPGICLEEPRKTTKNLRIAASGLEILTKDLLNAKQEY
jgi:hypothetical protein